nr:hypothetical protein [Bradyrhizobium sp. SZCCHNR1015]
MTFAALAGFSEPERWQMAAFRQREDAIAYAAAHGALRLLLGKLAGLPPGALKFEKGEHGKPFLCPPFGALGEPLQFCISHSSGFAAVALSCCAVGIDLERMSWTEDLLNVARDRFPEEHVRCLRSLKWRTPHKAFFPILDHQRGNHQGHWDGPQSEPKGICAYSRRPT